MTPPDRAGGQARLDADAGPLVRPYTVTGGRTRVRGATLDPLAFVVAVPGPGGGRWLPEYREILRYARGPVPVAELAAHLDLALGVVRVLLDDMVQDGVIAVHDPAAGTGQPDEHVLKAVINGLRAL